MSKKPRSYEDYIKIEMSKAESCRALKDNT